MHVQVLHAPSWPADLRSVPPSCRAVSGDGTTPVQRTLQQLQSSSGGRAFGHVMYSDDAPQPDGAPAADSPDAAFTQGRGVLVRPLTGHTMSLML